uniref:Uncharacterized protein n=1 Tax=Anguilla anguilla TaxID=7936 RepID=A0A0E9XUN9_ANGAN
MCVGILAWLTFRQQSRASSPRVTLELQSRKKMLTQNAMPVAMVVLCWC